MQLSINTADRFLEELLSKYGQDFAALCGTLERLDAPIYVTDQEGFVTYYNEACVGFTGRMPSVGKDRWCVTWKLYTTDGDYLPHEQCPMAVAIRHGKAVRGLSAVAARPDGTRVRFTAFPTPLRDVTGKLTGAINILVDVTDHRQIEALHEEARRCRRIASELTDEATRKTLKQMAAEYENKAAELGGPRQT